MPEKRALIVHDTRGLSIAAAAQSKAELETEGYQVDTKASFLETGLPANFFGKTIDTLVIEPYQRVIILNIALDAKDSARALQTLVALAEQLHANGRHLEYIDTHHIPVAIKNKVAEIREQCGILIRDHSRQAARSGKDSRRMTIGAISDRDSDPEILGSLNPDDEKIALGLDIAVRGDFQKLIEELTAEKEENLEQAVERFFLLLWNDQTLQGHIQQKVSPFVQKVKELKIQDQKSDFKKNLQQLILETFSEDFVRRAVEEMQGEHYDWFRRIAEREPKFNEVIKRAIPLGDLTVLPLADPITGWSFKMLDTAVQQTSTTFAIAFLPAAEDRRAKEPPADIVTIIKNWRSSDPRSVEQMFQGLPGEYADALKNRRGRENNVTLRLAPHDPKSLLFFGVLLKIFGGEKIKAAFSPWWAEVIKFYAALLMKASQGVERAMGEYLGEVEALEGKRFVDALVRRAAEALQTLTGDNPPSQEAVNDLLKRCDSDVVLTSILIRLLPRDAVKSLDIDAIKTVEVKKMPAQELQNNPSLQRKIVDILRAQFPTGDDQVFVQTVMSDPKQNLELCTLGEEILSLYVVKEENGVYHLDWLAINPSARIKGLGEATIMREFSRADQEERRYEAVVEPKEKTTVMALEQLGFVAYGVTDSDDPQYHACYLKVRKFPKNRGYRGKNLTQEEELKLINLATDVRRPYQLDSMTMITVEMPQDNDFILKMMREQQGKMAITRWIPNSEKRRQMCVIFEALAIPSTSAGEAQSDPLP